MLRPMPEISVDTGQATIGFTANAAALPHAGRLAQYTREAFATLERQARRAAG